MGRIERIKREEKKKPIVGNKLSIRKLSKREEFLQTCEWINRIINKNNQNK